MARATRARRRGARDAAAKDARGAGMGAILQPRCELAAARTDCDIGKGKVTDVVTRAFKYRHERWKREREAADAAQGQAKALL